MPLFKKANSLILFSKIEKLNLMDENISLDGTKLISVPLVFDFPTCFKEVLASPSLNSI